MTRNLLRAGALSCALLTSTALCTQPALAQTSQSAREHRALDANGVDLTHGDFVMSITEGSIGSGDAELALVRTGAWYSGYNGHQWDNITFRREVSGSNVSYVVTVGTESERFGSAGTLPTGSTLSGGGSSFTYRRADGTTIEFSDWGSGGTGTNSNFCTGDPAQGSCSLLATAIIRSDGSAVNLQWEVVPKCSGEITAESLPCTYEARLESVSNSFGYEIRFTYASNNPGTGGTPPAWFQRTAATFHNANVSGNPAQASVSYAYPATGVTQVTDMAGRVWRITGSFGAISAIRRPGTTTDTTTISYTNGLVSSITRDGVTTNYARSVSGNTATMVVTNALGQQSTIVSDMAIGRPKEVADGLGHKTQYQYDTHGRLARVTAPEGNYVQYTYDTRGNVTETRAVGKPGSGVADIVTTASFEATCANPVTCNSPTSTTDARGNVTNYEYDATHGGLLTVTAPAPTAGATRPQTRYAYTLLNGEYRLTEVSTCASGVAPACVGTATESRTVVAYDAQGSVTSVTQRDGTGALSAVSTTTYNALGDVETVDGPLAGAGDTTRLRYNAGRELIGTISADPDGAGPLKHRASRNIIDASTGFLTRSDFGTVNSQSDADWLNMAVHQSMEADYDAQARPTVQRLVAGGTTYSLAQMSYDALGRVECTAQRMNPAAFTSLPASACSLGTEGTFGPDRIAKASYDAAGQVTQMLSAVGTPHQAVEAAITYRANGQAETLTDGENNRTTYTYDGHDRLKRTLYPAPTRGAGQSSTTDYEELTYDAGSNVTSVRLRDGQSVGLGYDALNRLTSKDLPNTALWEFDASYGYDGLGRMVSAADTNGHQLSFGHDALGRLTSEGDSQYGVKGYQHDPAGRMTRMTWRDGMFVSYDHLVTGEVSAVRENGGTAVASYGYDQLGRRASHMRGNGASTSYVYDAAGRLGLLGHDLAGSGHDVAFSYAYNPAGQIVSRTSSNDAYTYTGLANQNATDSHNGLNQVVATATTSVTHDARGNTNAIGTATYNYTAENRLASGPGAALAYDPLGRLYYRGSTSEWWDHAGGQLVTEVHHPTNTITRRFAPGPGTDERAVGYEGSGSGNRVFYHTDERGSVIAHSDGSGNATAVTRYDEYGATEGTTGRFGYTGQVWLPELGMYHYKARVYNPGLAGGRFMQTDPIGYGDGMNGYAYVSGDPINFIDPLGLEGDSTTVWGKRQFDPCKRPKSTHDFIVCGYTSRPDLDPPRGSGGGGGVPSEEKQKEACRVDPRFSRPLADPDIKSQMEEAIRRADALSSFVEHAFWVWESLNRPDFRPGSIFSDGHERRISVTRRPSEWRSYWIHNIHYPRIFVYTHKFRGVVEDDLNALRKAGALAIVINSRREVFCHDPN